MFAALLTAAVAAGLCHAAPLPVERHVGRWTQKPQLIPTDLMFDSPIIGNGDIGMTFGGDPQLTTFYLGSNQFWSSNVNPDSPPDPQSEEAYTQVRIGDVQLIVPALSSEASYSASQELYAARINGSYEGQACTLHHSSIIDATENLLITTLQHNGGCGEVVFQLGAGNGSGYRYGPPLPSASGIADGKAWITRDSVTETRNSLTLARCYISGQHSGSQRWKVGADDSVELADGRCIESGAKLSIGEMGFQERWQFTKQGDENTGVLQSTATGKCAGANEQGNFLVVADCSSATVWSYNASSQHLYLPDAGDGWGTGKCLTAVEPNPKIRAGAALQLLAADGSPLQVQTSTDGQRFANLTLQLPQQAGTLQMLASVVTLGDCTGCDANTTDPAGAALQLLDVDVDKRRSAHAAWWHGYWTTGARIDLGTEHALLEGFYYGMQYQIGSASRAGKFAPGLWGPWVTNEICGWSGDYTLNYNFEANFYGVFSDGRPELALPYFQTILNHVELGKWRASMPFWGDALQTTGTPGFWAQDFNRMSQLSSTGYVPAGYRGVQLPTHFSPWSHLYFGGDWGQKNVAAFTAKAFADYYDFTGNATFLQETAYPYLKLVGDFYESYMTKENGNYNVMHSCAMESCFFQGAETQGDISKSNNPPFDLGFVKRTFRKLLEYSAVLSCDEDRRSLWQEILDNVAPYPLTQDEDANTVFAQATLNPTATSTGNTYGFPNASRCDVLSGGGQASDCANARYPIVHLNAIHPAEDIDLESEAAVLSIARQTAASINAINDYSPTNGLCQAWPPSARVVTNAADLIGKFEKALNDTIKPNFIPYIMDRPTGGSGCNIEQSGATVAVNDLLASVHGHGDMSTLRLLPGGWPAGQAVSFADIRVRGAFAVSAAAVGTGSGAEFSAVSIRSLAGRALTLRWPAVPSVTSSSGEEVQVDALGDGRYRFATTEGSTYTLGCGLDGHMMV